MPARPARHIVALGGGGFSDEGPGSPLDAYVLSLARASRPRVCFVPTASGDADSYLEKFSAAFAGRRCRRAVLSLFRPPRGSLRDFVLAQDVLYVGGGNTKSMLALWREWGLDRHVRSAWARGTVLAGVSAGMICWFEHGVTDSVTGTLGPLQCLGLLPGSACPHYDAEPGRRPTFRRLVARGRIPGGFAADDGAALHFTGKRLARVVTSRPGARAWRVERGADGRVVEREVVVPRGG